MGGFVALFQCKTNYFEKKPQGVKNTVEQDEPFLQRPTEKLITPYPFYNWISLDTVD